MSGTPTAMRFWSWSDVDPDARPFDIVLAREIVDKYVRDDVARDALEETIDRALISRYGLWIAGWRWAASEPGCGGLVRAWCCAQHSLLREDEPLDASKARVLDAIADWRNVLEHLARAFADLRALDATVEHAATSLLPWVLERTSAEDAWYATYGKVLCWYLESKGIADHSVREAVFATIGGRFSSWTTPDETACVETVRAIDVAVNEARRESPPVFDALAHWTKKRDYAYVPQPRALRDAVITDGHVRWIDDVDTKRDGTRGARMREALVRCRASARAGEPLTFERLAAWQAIVLGSSTASFRRSEAFAKEGRERYGFDDGTERQFLHAVAQSNDTKESAVARAARVYLDVCYFHPFADGNARAARLALDHVLTRAGLALNHVEPVFAIARSADDPYGLMNMFYVIDHLAGTASGA